MAAATKKKKRKEEAYPWRAGASSWHITNLKQSILETFDIYAWCPFGIKKLMILTEDEYTESISTKLNSNQMLKTISY